MADYDSPWKEVLDKFFALVVAFLLPRAHRDIDWTEDHEPVETELRKALPEAEVGLKRLDKLVRVVKGSGDPAYLHVEAQMDPEPDFERRMFVYHSKAEEVYNAPIVSLAILGDERADWRPSRYRFALWGCTKTFTFPSVKLLKWRGREGALERSRNPFAVFVLAHLQALATRHDEEGRAAGKVRLMLNLARRKLDGDDCREWLRLVDWLLELPRERNAAVWRRVREALRDKEKTMPFIDYLTEQEQLAEKRGEERGEKRGEERGEKRGEERGEKRGEERGEKRGRAAGLLKGIQALLKVRLPEQEPALMARVGQVQDPERLGRVLEAAAAADLDQLNALLP
jgi:hypothetical protein